MHYENKNFLPANNELVPKEILAKHFNSLAQEVPNDTQEISVDDDLLEKIDELTQTPFREVEKVTIFHSRAQYDEVNNTIYPEVISASINGWYGDMDVNERTITISIAGQTTDQEARGFIIQNFHDAESYPLQNDVTNGEVDFYQSIAGNYDQFIDMLGSETQITGVSSNGDFKRTQELREMDYDDLELLVHMIDRLKTQEE